VANTLYTPEQAARSTLAALRYLTVLPRTVRQDFSEDFVPGVGTVVNVRNPISAGASRVYTADDRTARNAIVFDDLTQSTVPVEMTDQVYKAVRLPDDFATFTLQQLEQQVLVPQAESVVDGIAAPLWKEMNKIDTDASIPTLTSSNALSVLIQARAVLNARKVPVADRCIALSPAAEAAFLELDLLQKVNESGSDGVLREAIIGRLMGFTIVSDPNLDGPTKVTITGSPSGGNFTLTYGGDTTGNIAHNATAATVETALEALDSIVEGSISVSGSAGGPYTIKGLADPDDLDATASLTGGSSPGVTVAASVSGYGVAYHRDAFAHVTRPSANPRGAAASATVSQDGFALRWLQHYNPSQLEDQSVVDTFVGAKTLDATRAVSFDMSA
jgi:hypothetical protein